MEIYNYHHVTGAYLSAGEADDNPLRPDEPIVPGYATPTPPPPAADGWVAVYRGSDGVAPQNWPGGGWSIVCDYRNVPLFRVADGSRYGLGDGYHGVGELPEGVTDLPRPSLAHVWAGAGWALDAALAAQLQLGDNKVEKSARETRARAAMEPLQMAVDIDVATAAEADSLLAWKRYFVLLSRVDLANPAWPEEPAA
ncbi:tail fiber assembly protein [Cupriavidus nantongensis]